MTYNVKGNVVIDDAGNGFFKNLKELQTPINIDPANAETNVAITSTVLSATPFRAIYATHYASQWQIANASSFAESSIVVDSGNVTPGSNTYTVATTLPQNTTLFWRVRYFSNDSPNIISSYSDVTSFKSEFIPPTTLGQSFGGGFYTGTVDIGGGVCYYLIVAPNSTGCACCQWRTSQGFTPGTSSDVNGYTNTRPPLENSTHPAGNWTATRTINGFSDWYLPAQNELITMDANKGYMPAGEGYNTSYGQGRYLSSTQGGFDNVCGVCFNYSSVSLFNICFPFLVRAVRRVPF